MHNKKYEQLIELIINEQETKARELFHDIVVEKSREIYESMMDEEMMGEEPSGQVMDMLDEISAEEAGGMTEAEDDAEFDEEDIDLDDGEGDEMDVDMAVDMDDEGDMDAEVDVDVDADEGSVDKAELSELKDKLDDLMSEFESIMAGEEDMSDEEDMEDAEDDMEDAEDDMEDAEDDMEDAEEDEEEALAEAVKLQKVSVTHGDNGAYTRSPSLHEPRVKAQGVSPVKFSGQHETVPTGPKGPSNYGTKGEKDLPGAGKFKNVPGGSKAKLENAPKPKHGDDGSNKKSPVAKG